MCRQVLMDERAQQKLREFASDALRQGQPTAWFDPLYRWADGNISAIPWAAKGVNPNLIAWLDREHVNGGGRRALVIGCGLGEDAEELASRDFDVTAFDVAPAAIEWWSPRTAACSTSA